MFAGSPAWMAFVVLGALQVGLADDMTEVFDPVLGVTLLYRKGYFVQELDEQGTQIEHVASVAGLTAAPPGGTIVAWFCGVVHRRPRPKHAKDIPGGAMTECRQRSFLNGPVRKGSICRTRGRI